MATKDWKKVKVEKGKWGNDYIVWEKEGDRISLWGLTSGRKNPNKRVSKTNIKIVWEVKNKKFKTKSQAMKSARNYMKTH